MQNNNNNNTQADDIAQVYDMDDDELFNAPTTANDNTAPPLQSSDPSIEQGSDEPNTPTQAQGMMVDDKNDGDFVASAPTQADQTDSSQTKTQAKMDDQTQDNLDSPEPPTSQAEPTEEQTQASEPLKAQKVPKPKPIESGFKRALSTPAARVAIALGVITFLPLAYCSLKPEKTGITLTGNEGFPIKAKKEQQLNTEQAEFQRQQALENQEGTGVNISAANHTVIEKSEFTPEEILGNPQRFVERRYRSQTVYLDRETQKIYNEQGYLLMIADVESPVIEQAPATYNTLYAAANQADEEALQKAGGTVTNNQMQAGSSYQPPPQGATYANYQANQQYAAQQQANANGSAQSAEAGVPSPYSPQVQDAITRYEDGRSQYLANLEQLAQNRAILSTPPAPMPATPNQLVAQQAVANAMKGIYQQKQSGFSFSTPATANKTSGGVTFSMDGITSNNGSNASSSGTSGTSQQTTQGTADATASVASSSSGKLAPNTIRQGTEWLAVVVNEVDTDHSSEVTAMLLNGHYAGSLIRGAVALNGTRNIGVSFSVIEPKDPTLDVVPISAKAISMATQRDAVATDVNNHYARNYTSLVLQSAINGYGAAYADLGASTEINRSDGTVITTTDGQVNEKEIYGQMLASLSQRLSADAALLGNRPATYKIAQGTVIKVRLLNNLTYSN